MNPVGAGGAAPLGRGSYLDTLNLQRPPFNLAPEPAFFYADPTLIQRLDLLVHLAQFSDRILVLTGPAGAGKTSLLQQFMSRAGENWRVCAMDSSEIPHRNALLARLASCFGAAGKAQSTEVDVTALLDRWSALQSSGFLPMIVIDDAHKLNGGTIEALLNLASDPARTAKRVRLILLGETGLLERLSQNGLHAERDHLIHTMNLSPLTAEQTAAYLTYRLAVAGYSGESPFPPSEAQAIHKAAGGLPGRINRFAHQYLEGHRATRGTPGSATRRTGRRFGRWLLVACGLAAAATVLWKQHAINQLFTPPTAATRRKTVELKLPATPKKQSQGNHHPAPLAHTPPAASPVSNGSAGGTTSAALPARQPAMTAPPGLFAEHPTPATPATKGRTPVTTRPSAGHATAAKSGAPKALATSPASSAGATQPTPSAATPAGTTPVTVNSKPAHAPATAAKPAAVQTPQPTKSPRKTVTSIPRSGPLRASWLLQQRPSAYTLQILGARDKSSVPRFIKAHRLGKQAMYYAADFKGSPWYVLIYGIYPNIKAAREALQALPPKVRNGGPWIRRLSAVQHDIRHYRKTLNAAPRKTKAQ